MKQIHTQFWVSLFMNNIEVYANWRRTGYPELTPTNYPGNQTGGVIPRRLRYPESEANLNTEAYNAAVRAQGPDLFITRIWWDKEILRVKLLYPTILLKVSTQRLARK